MVKMSFPTIDMKATGKNILNLRKQKGMTVHDLQTLFNLNEPTSIYKWQRGECLPSLDNLYALSFFLGVSIDQILIGTAYQATDKQQVNTRDIPDFHLYL